MKNAYDVIVIGAGPAGSTTAGLVAQSGKSVLLVEREKFPRFHVGESLMPETFWPLERLGLVERMKASQFVRKHSVQFVTSNGKESEPFYFQQHDPRESSVTWQVERAEFDKMLFDRAAELGADCVDECRVMEVIFDEMQKATGVRIKGSDGQSQSIAASIVVDATGQQTLIANSLGLKQYDPKLKKAGIWGYWKNAMRDEGQNAGATIIMHTDAKASWFWFIPLSDDITSIGVVGDHDYMLKRGTSFEQTYADEIAICAGLLPRLKEAQQVGKLHVAKEYTYWTSQHAGDGWVLVGDALGFIDPIYSSGVYFAMVMGERAADAIIEGLEKGDYSAQQLSKWCPDFKNGAKWLRKLVDAYYTKEFSFGGFMRDNPQFRGNLTDLLIGRIFYDGVGDMGMPAIWGVLAEFKNQRMGSSKLVGLGTAPGNFISAC
jgi:flavin-dependent dehydrogenase